jgi:hypothetical protein
MHPVVRAVQLWYQMRRILFRNVPPHRTTDQLVSSAIGIVLALLLALLETRPPGTPGVVSPTVSSVSPEDSAEATSEGRWSLKTKVVQLGNRYYASMTQGDLVRRCGLISSPCERSWNSCDTRVFSNNNDTYAIQEPPRRTLQRNHRCADRIGRWCRDEAAHMRAL